MEKNAKDKALEQFAELMIDKINEVSKDWKQPWFSSTRGFGLPQNLSGRSYNGLNSFILFLQQARKNYKTPVFMTFLQAKEKGVSVLKGEKSFPVLYWNFTIKDKNGNKIPKDEYNSMTREQKKECEVRPFAEVYRVFNLDQTNFAEVHPDKWAEIQNKFKVPDLKDEKGMFASPELDKMLQNQTWVCPVIVALSDGAYYSPGKDEIHVPLKGQFDKGENFYSTLLHEMAHSTGVESRLGREVKNVFGDPKYAKEELVAELTAAVTSQSLGIVAGIQEENAKYLKSWLSAIKQEPQFLYNVLADVGKASTMILNEVGKEQEKKAEKEEQKEPE